MEEVEKIEILKRKLTNTIGKYAEYRSCCRMIIDLDEKYDEILEQYDFIAWEGTTGGTIRDKAAYMLSVTEELFWDLVSNAEKELFSVLQEIMRCNKEEQKLIWGKELFLSKSDITEDKLKDYLLEWEEYACVKHERGDFDIFITMIEDVVNDKKD